MSMALMTKCEHCGATVEFVSDRVKGAEAPPVREVLRDHEARHHAQADTGERRAAQPRARLRREATRELQLHGLPIVADEAPLVGDFEHRVDDAGVMEELLRRARHTMRL